MRMEMASNTDERELQLFLYHLTQEILSSRDYSDCNISRICSKFYNTSSYPDKERLRRLIGALKRKLQLEQSDQQICVQYNPETERPCRCNRCKEEYENTTPPPPPPPPQQQLVLAPMERAILDKCVGTQSLPAFFPETAAVVRIDETAPLLSTQNSQQSYATVTPCSTSAGTHCSTSAGTHCSTSAGTQCSSVYSVKQRRDESSNESDTLIEQILLRHKGLPKDTSSDVLLRMAAADRMICDSCHGRCPLQRCQTLTGAGVPGPSCARTGTTRCDLNRPLPKKTCKCPLKQCGHFSSGGGGAGGCSGGCASDAPILRQDVSITPPVTCCGARRKRSKQPLVACRERSKCRKDGKGKADSRKK